MKKMIMLVVAALALSTAATAQLKVDVDGLKKKIATADADVQNAKKGARAATWIARGNAYYNADVAPTAALRAGMPVAEINLVVGRPTETREETVAGNAYQVWVYPHFDLYMAGDQLIFWKQKTVVVEDGLQTAFESYTKAAELDPKQNDKMRAEIAKLINQYIQYGENAFQERNFDAAARDFAKAYTLSASPLVNQPDTLTIFNAGYVSVLNEKYDDAIQYLNTAKELGYGNDGEVYLYLYHAYNGKKDIAGAENVLKEGIRQFPANNGLIEALIVLYASNDQDATQIIPMVEEAIANDPNNAVLHFGLGLIHNRLDNFDQAIEQFGLSSKLNPNDYAAAFNLGLTYLRKADDLQKNVIDKLPFNDQAARDEKTAEFNALYRESIPHLEQAHTLNPTDRSVVDVLKSVFFRLRDESPEMMSGYEKYDALLKTMPQ